MPVKAELVNVELEATILVRMVLPNGKTAYAKRTFPFPTGEHIKQAPLIAANAREMCAKLEAKHGGNE